MKSVSRRVTNISEHLATPISLRQFIGLIHREVLELYPETRAYEFSEADRQAIQALVDSKYDSWEWNFGHSPAYNHVQAIRCEAGTLEFHADVHRGCITALRVFGDFFGDRDVAEFEAALIGLPHREDELRPALDALPLREFFGPVSVDDILPGLI